MTQHQGMNATHDWDRTQRRDKINNKLMTCENADEAMQLLILVEKDS